MCQPSPAGRGCWQPAQEGGEENTWILGFRRRNEVPEPPGRPFLGQGPGGRGSGGGFGAKNPAMEDSQQCESSGWRPTGRALEPSCSPIRAAAPSGTGHLPGLLVHRWEAEPFTHLRPL